VAAKAIKAENARVIFIVVKMKRRFDRRRERERGKEREREMRVFRSLCVWNRRKEERLKK
jgi:hypothetical protein